MLGAVAMPSRSVLACLSLLLLSLPACGGADPHEHEDIIWEPPLSSSSGGELDFGEVPLGGDAVQEFVTGTNNTDEAISFEVEVNLDAAEGWIWTAPPGPFDVEPDEDVAFGPRFNPNGNTPAESTGTVTFFWDDHVVTYVIRASVP